MGLQRPLDGLADLLAGRLGYALLGQHGPDDLVRRQRGVASRRTSKARRETLAPLEPRVAPSRADGGRFCASQRPGQIAGSRSRGDLDQQLLALFLVGLDLAGHVGMQAQQRVDGRAIRPCFECFAHAPNSGADRIPCPWRLRHNTGPVLLRTLRRLAETSAYSHRGLRTGGEDLEGLGYREGRNLFVFDYDWRRSRPIRSNRPSAAASMSGQGPGPPF
jgi:hypothetical protein